MQREVQRPPRTWLIWQDVRLRTAAVCPKLRQQGLHRGGSRARKTSSRQIFHPTLRQKELPAEAMLSPSLMEGY
jgi:hypothetical protein